MIGLEVASCRILSRLGAGGMGEVWLAEHTVLGRRVAMKFLLAAVSRQSDVVERLFDEARATARVVDPGIVHIYEVGWHGDRAYIAMEYLEGETLSARLAREGRLAPSTAIRITHQIAMTMAVAHGVGIIHRDLKPDNLFVVADPAVPGGERIKILDFGIAKLVGDEQSTSRTRSGVIMGTPMYMSPEQCRGAGAVDHRTDIYALGCVLYHLLAGRPPFLGATPGDMIASHLLEEPSRPGLHIAIPVAVDDLVMRCLAKSPDDRVSSMTELVRACVALNLVASDVVSPLIRRDTPVSAIRTAPGAGGAIGLLPTLATGPGAPAAPAPAPMVRRVWIAAGAAALVVAFVVGWFVTSERHVASATGGSPADASREDAASFDPARGVIDAPLPDAAPADAQIPIDAPRRRIPQDTRYDPYADP